MNEELEETKEEKQIEKEFNKLIESLTDDEFWAWVREWNEDDVMNIINDWDTETKKNAIVEIIKIKEDLKNNPNKEHLEDILNECYNGKDLEQIEHNVFEIAEHLGIGLCKGDVK